MVGERMEEKISFQMLKEKRFERVVCVRECFTKTTAILGGNFSIFLLYSGRDLLVVRRLRKIHQKFSRVLKKEAKRV